MTFARVVSFKVLLQLINTSGVTAAEVVAAVPVVTSAEVIAGDN